MLHDGKAWRVAGLTEDHQVELLRPGGSTPACVGVGRVVPISQWLSVPRVEKSIESIPEEVLDRARDRRKAVLKFLGSGMDVLDLKAASAAGGCHPSTFLRWVDRFVGSGGKLTALLPSAGRYGNSNRRLSGRVLALLEFEVERNFLSRTRYREGRIYKNLKSACELEAIAPPARSTVFRYLKSLPGEEVITKRVGKRAARELFRPHAKKARAGEFPLHLIQIDHTLLDIFVRLTETIVKRPWITLAIDSFSRMIVGFHLSFDGPSTLAVGLCMYRVMSPKEDWLNAFGIQALWPTTGRPYIVHADNGMDFRTKHLQFVALEHDITVSFRAVKVPEWGAYIERMMGTLALEMETLPGATFRDLALRKKLDEKPEGVACLTLDQLEKILLHFFVEKYHQGPHAGIGGASPISRWNEGWAGMDLSDPLRQHVLIDPNPGLLLNLLPSFERVIRQNGINWDKRRYFDYALRPHIRGAKGANRGKHERFHYDPRNVKFIYFRDLSTDTILQIPAKDTGFSDISLWETEAQESEAAARALKTVNHSMVRRGEESIATVVAESRAQTPSRKAQRKQRTATRKQLSELRVEGKTSASLGTTEIQSKLNLPSKFEEVTSGDPWTEIPEFDSGDF